jgi:hypothetical protein
VRGESYALGVPWAIKGVKKSLWSALASRWRGTRGGMEKEVRIVCDMFQEVHSVRTTKGYMRRLHEKAVTAFQRFYFCPFS